MNIIYRIICAGLGIIFIWASVDKIMYPSKFAEMVYHYKMLPDILIHSVALFLPWMELIIGLLLILGIWEQWALIIYNGLIVVFMIGLSSALIRGLDIHCGCFTVDPNAEKELLMSLLRDIPLFIISMGCLFISIKNRKKAKI